MKNIKKGASRTFTEMVGVTYIFESPDGSIKPYSIHTNLEHFKNVHKHVSELNDHQDHFKSKWYYLTKEKVAMGMTDSEDCLNAALHYLCIDEVVTSGLNTFNENGVGFFVTLNLEDYNTPSIVSTTFSDWLDVSNKMLTQAQEYEHKDEVNEQELTVIRSPETEKKEMLGETLNWITINVWIFDEDNQVHTEIFKCSRDLLESAINKEKHEPEFLKMMSLTSETIILEAISDISKTNTEMDFLVMLIEHLGLQSNTQVFLNTNPECNLNFSMAVNSKHGESTQVLGSLSDEPETSSMN